MKLTLKIEQDQDAANPREEFDHVGTMVCWHNRYSLGDGYRNGKPINVQFGSPEEFQDWWKENGKGGLILPLYLYDHSGITISAKPFSCPWDSGQVGWIYATRETILKEFCKGNRVTPKAMNQTKLCLLAEVEEYDQYLTGQVYGYIVEDDDGNTVDSCWGFYGEKYATEEGEQALKNAQAEAEEEAVEAHEMACRDLATVAA